MKKALFVIVVFLALASGCGEEKADPAFEHAIIGNWQVVNEEYTQSVVEWGFWYVATVKLNEDKSFKINVWDAQSDPLVPKAGTWKLTNKGKSIAFYTAMEDGPTIYRDTTVFKISLTDDDKLVLGDGPFPFVHHRIPN